MSNRPQQPSNVTQNKRLWVSNLIKYIRDPSPLGVSLLQFSEAKIGASYILAHFQWGLQEDDNDLKNILCSNHMHVQWVHVMSVIYAELTSHRVSLVFEATFAFGVSYVLAAGAMVSRTSPTIVVVVNAHAMNAFRANTVQHL